MERLLATVKGTGPNGKLVYLEADPDGVLLVRSADASASSAAADRELVTTRYNCKQAFPGAVVGDLIRQTVALDVSGASMTVVSVLWENESQGSIIAAPPTVTAYLESTSSGSSLTLAQLLSAGLATASNQVAQIGYLADIAQASGKYSAYSTQEVDESNDLINGTTYVRKAGSDSGDTWLIMRIVESGTSTVITYAGVRNNSAITTASAAWAARAALVYGEVTAA